MNGWYSINRSAPDEPRRRFVMIDWQADVNRITEILARYAPTATINNELPRPKNASGDAPEMSASPPTAQP